MALCAKETPELVLIGLHAGIDGVEATRRIMAGTPCAIVIVTDSVQVNAACVFEAMGHGALDVVGMPAVGNGNLRGNAAPLLAKIATVSRLIGDRTARRVSESGSGISGEPRRHPLIAMGASAGGPRALAAVLQGLPKGLPADHGRP